MIVLVLTIGEEPLTTMHQRPETHYCERGFGHDCFFFVCNAKIFKEDNAKQ